MHIGEDELLQLLNSAPVVDGRITETLADSRMRELRDELHAIIRGTARPVALAPYLKGVSRKPRLGQDGVSWRLEGASSTLKYAEYVLAWSDVEQQFPGRLRACGNDECNKFLIDHSKPNAARWCSMASCGNRMKARRHYARQAMTTSAPR